MTIESREAALENKYAKDEEFRFRVNAKAAHLLGLWAAKQMGMKDDAAARYADAVLHADIERSLKQALHKVRHDLGDHGVTVTEHHVENQMNIHLAEARKSLA